MLQMDILSHPCVKSYEKELEGVIKTFGSVRHVNEG